MDLQLANKVVIITGSAKGIGEGITKVLAREEAIPIIVGRSVDDNKQLAEYLTGEGLEASYVFGHVHEQTRR